MKHLAQHGLILGGWRKTLLVVLFGLLAVPSAFAQTLQLVLPSQTDSNITAFNNYHFVYLNTNVPARQQLFVFLPGTGGTPSGYQYFLKTAANLGFHTVGLMYDDAVTMNSLCGDSTNADCYAQARLAVINGGTNSVITVASYDSITNRLIKLLTYLAANKPGQNWNQYLDAQSNLMWPMIVISGHSQGAGHSGLIAKVYAVARSVMFADTDWWTPNGRFPGQPADWISTPGVTADGCYFGFVHVQDPLIPYAEEIPTWNAYGLSQFGGPLLVESNPPPFLGTHMLTTGLPPQNATNFHGATVVDSATPLAADGVTPVYQPVWQFMMVGPPELPRLQITPGVSNQVQLTFGTFTNYTYHVQATTSLSSGWTNAGSPVAGNGAPAVLYFNVAAPARFFRVAVQ